MLKEKIKEIIKGVIPIIQVMICSMICIFQKQLSMKTEIIMIIVQFVLLIIQLRLIKKDREG